MLIHALLCCSPSITFFHSLQGPLSCARSLGEHCMRCQKNRLSAVLGLSGFSALFQETGILFAVPLPNAFSVPALAKVVPFQRPSRSVGGCLARVCLPVLQE